VDADAEKVGTFDGDTNLFVQLDASVAKTSNIGGGEAGVRGGDVLDDDIAILIVGVDANLQVPCKRPSADRVKRIARGSAARSSW